MVLPMTTLTIKDFVDDERIYEGLLKIKELSNPQQIKLMQDGFTKGFWLEPKQPEDADNF